ncbi:MAG: hypothetical protein LBH98_07855 [Chitinispirillales bacterium]|jgi:hypothetical protein|nr:hypothetical protein [Chitinispirillales bacterium]
MSIFTNDEKQVIKEALSIYIQMAAQQMPAEMVEQLGLLAKSILQKADKASGDGDGEEGNKPHNISDEWYENVCMNCEKLDFSGCTDSVTAKYPGKCDPILKYEFEKAKK